jgi:hypothetical protein
MSAYGLAAPPWAAVNPGHPLAAGLALFLAPPTAAGPKFRDALGRRDATLGANADFTGGPSGKAFRCDGTAGAVSLLASPLDCGPTHSLWIRIQVNAIPATGIVVGGDASVDYFFALDGTRFYYKRNGTLDGASHGYSISTGGPWDDWIVTRNASNAVAMFKNGVALAVSRFAGNPAGNLTIKSLGGYSDTTSPSKVSIGGLAIWANRVLTPAEVGGPLMADPFGVVRPRRSIALLGSGAGGGAPAATPRYLAMLGVGS